jgi:hydroxymethylpyrimidine/phosphomethylpyrimidine kinase
MTPPVVVSIAATDSGGGAGLAADLTTIAALGAHGAAVVTAVTAQDTRSVRSIHAVPADAVESQLNAVFEDLSVAAAKTGVLATAGTAHLVADWISEYRLIFVIDPVLRASTGRVLADSALVDVYRRRLLPLATVVTPNPAEARILAGCDRSSPDLAHQLADTGCAVVITGGPEDTEHRDVCVDWLALPGAEPQRLEHPGVATRNDHGTGCTFASALATLLAHGRSLEDSVPTAGTFVAGRLHQSRSWHLGHGRGPIAHTFTKESP